MLKQKRKIENKACIMDLNIGEKIGLKQISAGPETVSSTKI